MRIIYFSDRVAFHQRNFFVGAVFNIDTNTVTADG
jgi:hypothetical protein